MSVEEDDAAVVAAALEWAVARQHKPLVKSKPNPLYPRIAPQGPAVCVWSVCVCVVCVCVWIRKSEEEGEKR